MVLRLQTSSATTGSIAGNGAAAPTPVAQSAAVYQPGPQTMEEELILQHLNAITQQALPHHEWHRLGPGWKPYYNLLHRSGETLQDQWYNGAIPNDVFEKLNRALKIPSLSDAKEIKASGPGTLTMFFCDAIGSRPEGYRYACMNTGHPLVIGGHAVFLEELVPVVIDGQYVPYDKGGIYCVRTGNLAFLQQEWQTLKARVDFEFGLTTQEPPAFREFVKPQLAVRTEPTPAS